MLTEEQHTKPEVNPTQSQDNSELSPNVGVVEQLSVPEVSPNVGEVETVSPNVGEVESKSGYRTNLKKRFEEVYEEIPSKQVSWAEQMEVEEAKTQVSVNSEVNKQTLRT
eukprot:Nk52_evm1s1065 gene=Nk52_evmTU1s1065